MEEIFEAVESGALSHREALLLFFMLNPTLKQYLKKKGVFEKDAQIVIAVIGKEGIGVERLEEICDDLNLNTVFDTEVIRRLGDIQNK